MGRIKSNILAGVLTLVPIFVTIWIITFIVQTLIGFGRPLVLALALWVGRGSPDTADLMRTDVFQSILALLLVLLGLYALGALTTAVVGRRVLSLFDRTVEALPLVRTLYRGVRRMLEAFQSPGGSAQRVALIRFPTPEMRTLGFVTRIFEAADRDGLQLASVYVPTAPNPTSGYVEIVPVEDLIFLDWSTDEAMQFVVSAGALAPARIPFGRDLPRSDGLGAS